MDNRTGVIPRILKHSKAFSVTSVAVFLLSYAFLWSVGATPDPFTAGANGANETATHGTAVEGEPSMPVRVAAESINLDVSVSNPSSTNISVLDNALLDGAVRYPTSAKLGEEGTVLLFGHSSYLPIVHNQAYKAFNEIQDLKTDAVVSVYSGDTEYRYSVVGVRLADATEDVIELPQSGKHLVLVTCDSFSKKTSRFVVTADFVGAYALASS